MGLEGAAEATWLVHLNLQLPHEHQSLLSGDPGFEGKAGAVSREVQVGITKRFSPRSCWGTDQAPQGTGTAPKLPELQEHLDTTSRDRVGLLGCPEQGWELDSVIVGVPCKSGYSRIPVGLHLPKPWSQEAVPVLQHSHLTSKAPLSLPSISLGHYPALVCLSQTPLHGTFNRAIQQGRVPVRGGTERPLGPLPTQITP